MIREAGVFCYDRFGHRRAVRVINLAGTLQKGEFHSAIFALRYYPNTHDSGSKKSSPSSFEIDVHEIGRILPECISPVLDHASFRWSLCLKKYGNACISERVAVPNLASPADISVIYTTVPPEAARTKHAA